MRSISRLPGALAPVLLLAASQNANGPIKNAPIKFAVIGDYGDAAQADNVAALVKGQKVDYVLTVGDNCYGSSPRISRQVGDKYGAFVSERAFWPSLGNHDYSDGCGGGSATAYFAYFTLPDNERYYDFAVGPVHFFAINSNKQEPNGNGAGSKQAHWLKRGLARAKEPWKIVYFHHPAYSSGEHGSSRTMQWPFEAWGASLVLSGHDHDYERIQRDDDGDGQKLTYIVDGMGGKPPRAFSRTVGGSVFQYNSGNGALFVTATDSRLSLQFRNTGCNIIDAYTLKR